MKILVTGGAGFIGSHITDALLARNHEVVVADSLVTGSLSNLPIGADRLTFVETDLEHKSFYKLIAEGKFDAICHQAAIANIGECERNINMSRRINQVASQRILLAARDARIRRVVFASTSSVYGDQSRKASEDLLGSPKTAYGKHKLLADASMRKGVFGVSSIALRYFNVYGPRQRSDGHEGAVVAAFARAIQAGDPLTVHGDGEQVRDFVFVKDVAEANVLALEWGGHASLALNVGTGDGVTVIGLALAMAVLTKRSPTVTPAPARENDIAYSCADTRTTKAILGFTAQTSLSTGLVSTLTEA